MNIFVCVKQVPDTETKVTPNSDGTFIETSSIKWIMNPYDEFAVEQALLLKAANTGSSVTVVRVGGKKDTEALRTALAMGADDAILVEAEDNLDSYNYVSSSNTSTVKERTSKTSNNINVKVKQAIENGYTGDICPECQSITMVRNGTCLKCMTCGSTTGCS